MKSFIFVLHHLHDFVALVMFSYISAGFVVFFLFV